MFHYGLKFIAIIDFFLLCDESHQCYKKEFNSCGGMRILIVHLLLNETSEGFDDFYTQ